MTKNRKSGRTNLHIRAECVLAAYEGLIWGLKFRKAETRVAVAAAIESVDSAIAEFRAFAKTDLAQLAGCKNEYECRFAHEYACCPWPQRLDNLRTIHSQAANAVMQANADATHLPRWILTPGQATAIKVYLHGWRRHPVSSSQRKRTSIYVAQSVKQAELALIRIKVRNDNE